MVTNSIQQLQDGEGNYNFVLNAQGRIQGDATIFARARRPPHRDSRHRQVADLIALLDHFIIMDDVELADISAHRSHGLLVAGPSAAPLLAANRPQRRRSRDLERRDHRHGTPPTSPSSTPTARSFPASSSGPTPDDRSKLSRGPPKRRRHASASRKASNGSASSKARPSTAPTSATASCRRRPARPAPCTSPKAATSGQEIVERIRSRGNVHRTFTAFRLDGDAARRRSTTGSRRQAGRRTHQRRRHPAARDGGTHPARPRLCPPRGPRPQRCPFTTPAEPPSLYRFPFHPLQPSAPAVRI